MQLSKLVSSTEHFLRSNSTTLLTGIGISGVLTTAYFTARGTVKAVAEIERDHEIRRDPDGVVPYLGRWHGPKLIWKYYIPAGMSAAFTITAIIGAQKAGVRKTAAAQAAFAVTERAFSEYREKVVEEIGEQKERKIHDKTMQDRVSNNPPPEHIVAMSGTGSCIFREDFTGRYFVSTMETVKKSVNELNSKLLRDDRAYLDDFYHLVGLGMTQQGGEYGWETPRLLELRFTTSTVEDRDVPCFVFTYNYVKPI